MGGRLGLYSRSRQSLGQVLNATVPNFIDPAHTAWHLHLQTSTRLDLHVFFHHPTPSSSSNRLAPQVLGCARRPSPGSCDRSRSHNHRCRALKRSSQYQIVHGVFSTSDAECTLQCSDRSREVRQEQHRHLCLLLHLCSDLWTRTRPMLWKPWMTSTSCWVHCCCC